MLPQKVCKSCGAVRGMCIKRCINKNCVLLEMKKYREKRRMIFAISKMS